MGYITYNYYLNEYCGGSSEVVADKDFHKYLMQAQSVIDLYTLNRCRKMEEIPVDVKNCCCELIELIGSSEQKLNNANGITSEKINNYSVTFESSESIKNRLETEKRTVVMKWLESSGLLYRGC